MSADALLVAVRALHFAAAIVLFGETAFAALAADVHARAPVSAQNDPLRRLDQRAHRVVAWAWLALVASGVAWLVLVAAQMAGAPLADALDRATLAATLGSTEFGQAWTLRAIVAMLWLLTWRATSPAADHDPMRPRRAARGAAVVAAGGLLAGLAWAGHANAGTGTIGVVHRAGDALHLLAAGLWLGGLAPLRSLLRALPEAPGDALVAAAVLTARFGRIAAASVFTLLVTGGANAWFLIASPRELVASAYGNVLLAKLLLFALMLAVAAANRFRWTVALNASASSRAAHLAAAHRLRRNAAIEQLLAVGVVLLVAWLGVLPPPIRM